VTINVALLGAFEVTVDGAAVPPEAWSRRHAASLVKVLALAPGRRLHREQVIDALWPGQSLDGAAPRLHKATHYARKALGEGANALLSRNEMLALGEDVRVDAEEFRRLGERALLEDTADAAVAALAVHRGPLLPEDLYEPWAQDARDRVRILHLDLLRLAQRWEDVLREDPADEQAHIALMRSSADRGDIRGALRQFERMDHALRRELGTVPSAEAQQLRAQLERRAGSGSQPQSRRLFGRRDVGNMVRERLDEAAGGRGGALLFAGPPGVGKSAVLDLAERMATGRGWRTGRGTASAVEGPWPYAPVLEALNDLCRKHHALLDGLDDVYRLEIERALSGRDVTWSGESGHQRLFVAAAELIRLAAAGHGLLIVVDDVHEADDASLRLLHYLSRCAMTEPVLIVLAHRPLGDQPLRGITESIVARGTGIRVELRPLSEGATRRLLADRFPDLPPETVDRIWAVSAGLAFTALELARSHVAGAPAVLSALPAPVLGTFQRLALLGSTFTTDELLAVSGGSSADEEEAYRQLDVALRAMLVERAELGYRFRHALVREALLQTMSPSVEATALREVAEALAQTNAPPGRIAHQFLAAGLAARAVPYALRAVETAGALGAYRDGLSLIDAVRPHASPAELPRLLARRGDLLLALGDTEAVAAYQEAVAVTKGTEHRLVRARLARAASFAGDFDTARAAIAGLSLEGDAADASILRAQGHLAYFSGDLDSAWRIAGQARELLQSPDDPLHLVDLLTLQGLIAHNRGEWFERFRIELRRTQGKQRLVTALFDAHLCVAEYLLYGTVPYAEVIEETEDLRRRAAHAGALRGVAFATALIGEAALMMGDLERAERELLEAVDLHRDVDAPAGEAHCLQRLAEVRLAQGDRVEAQRLLQQALPVARWSAVASHLLQRIYGTMIAAAPDTATARAIVDLSEATMGETDRCRFCAVMLAAPATIACADVGDIVDARRHLAVAESSAALWEGSAWEAAVCEARAHVARAEGRMDEFAALLARAAQLFHAAGHHRDAVRCELQNPTRMPAPRPAPKRPSPRTTRPVSAHDDSRLPRAEPKADRA
jgi:DNA-binding SARP family transcriptional activator/tetratricopeptide (TPR) repeat protein